MIDYGSSPIRFIRIKCPLCLATSPLCDQTTDIRRDLLRRWWRRHLDTGHPYPSPIFQAATPSEAEAAQSDG